jgi:hypothetical protein
LLDLVTWRRGSFVFKDAGREARGLFRVLDRYPVMVLMGMGMGCGLTGEGREGRIFAWM